MVLLNNRNKIIFVANIIANTVCILLKVKFVLALSGISFIIAAGHQPAADHILDPFEIFGSMVSWFHCSIVDEETAYQQSRYISQSLTCFQDLMSGCSQSAVLL